LSSGACLAFPFYLLAPHPDSVIHGLLFFGGYLIYLVAKSNKSISRKIEFLILPAIGFTVGAARFAAPIFSQVRIGEAFYFGHDEMFHHSFSQSMAQF